MENRPVANARTDVAKASRIGINKEGLLKKVSPPLGLKIAIIAKNNPSISADDIKNQKDHLLSLFLGKIENFKYITPFTLQYYTRTIIVSILKCLSLASLHISTQKTLAYHTE